MRHRIKEIWRNIGLTGKLNLIILLSICFVSLAGLASIRYLTVCYNEELYEKNAMALKYITSDLETELKAISTMTDYMVADETVQYNLTVLKDSPDPAKRTRARRIIYDCLYSYLDASSAISYISLVLPDQIIHMGTSNDLDELDLQTVNGMADEAKGRLIWTGGASGTDSVFCVRQIRQKAYLKLDSLATLYVKVDMNRLVDRLLNTADITRADLDIAFVSEEGAAIYPSESPYKSYCEDYRQSAAPYRIEKIGGQAFFITSGTLPVTGWTYVNFSDYNRLFSRLNMVMRLCMFLFVCAALTAMLFIYLIIRSIIRHFHILEKKMAYFEEGNLDLMPCAYHYELRGDEIGVIHQRFDQMVCSYRRLINDNYVKQLLLKDATIKMLEQQINPHFLYNVLDSINWMAQTYGAEDISEMSFCLGKLFRAAISEQSDRILLSTELDFLDNYIRIQKIRFRDRLIFEKEIPDSCLTISIPKLSIQPLVENAIRHSLECSDEPCRINLRLAQEGKILTVYVANTGSRFDADLWERLQNRRIRQEGSGVGLTNIDARLKLIYGDSCGLHFMNQKDRAVVYFRIPMGEVKEHA
ncbi:sensor histidine kinase [Lachnotalea sp. AF33-28]|uniref:sensor histidine kinase n=1 Tax=Lachnotalea sp. AF33-28 TaxID=2292046 RepID=UPI001313DADC|nr:histidine kinase [Lachnotalea sp. AF33-28]